MNNQPVSNYEKKKQKKKNRSLKKKTFKKNKKYIHLFNYILYH